MVSTDFEADEAEVRQEDQPGLSDIHAILKGLLKSMKNLSKELSELNISFKQQETELRNAKEALNAALKYNDQLRIQKELKATRQRAKEQEQEEEEEIDELYENMDALEQYTRKNSLD